MIGILGTVTMSIISSAVRGGLSSIETEPGGQKGSVTLMNSVVEGAWLYGVNLNSMALKVRGCSIKSAGVGVRVRAAP